MSGENEEIFREGKCENMRDLFRIFEVLPKEQHFQCVGMLVAMFFGAALEAVGIGAVLPLISILGNPEFLCQYPRVAEIAYGLGLDSHSDIIMASAVLITGLYFLKNLYIVWESRLQIRFSMKNQIYYAKALLAEYLMKPYLFHVNNNTATLIRNVNSGPQTVFANILVSVLQLLTEIVTALTIWGMLVMLDPFIAIVVAGVLFVLLVGILRVFRRGIVSQGIIQNRYAVQYGKWLHQCLGAIKETKVMHKEGVFLEAFGKAYAEYGEAQGQFAFLNQVPRSIIEFLVLSGMMSLIIVKVLFGESPESIVAVLGVLALAAFRLMPSAYRIVSYVNNIKFQMPLFNELKQELEDIRQRRNRHELIPIEDAPDKMPFTEEIAVNHLGFRFSEETKEVLQDVSFKIHKGAYIGIIGSSGAGKTTFVDILLGLFSPSKGSICVDGCDIQTDIRGWQENLAYVPQSIYLIDATIKENIALGEIPEKIDYEKVEKVLRMAELYDFVQELPDGVDTIVGERGVKLSGGQRQRIGIARALYQEPEVLILDEATSALDNATEKSITDAVLKMKGFMTIISIAHRLSTLRDCDFKVAFEQGTATIVQES